MANPQKENGFVPIANEIMEALSHTQINGEAWRILLFILRKTYGYNKKEDSISLSQFSTGTGLTTSHVPRSIKILEKMNIITCKRDKNNPVTYQFQKNYHKWVLPEQVLPEQVLPEQVLPEQVLPEQVLPEQDLGTTKTGLQVLPALVDTKDNTKDNTKDKYKSIVKKTQTARFCPPSLEEVKAYCLERKNTVDSQRWIDYYTSNGWKVGRNSMKDWKAAVRTWEKNNAGLQKSSIGGSGAIRDFAAERQRLTEERNARVLRKLNNMAGSVHREEAERSGVGIVDSEAHEIPDVETGQSSSVHREHE